MRRLVIQVLTIAGAACQPPLGPCAPETSVAGIWRYAGLQDASGPVQLSGTLEVSSESCEGFQGRLDVVEVNELGSRRLAGPVAGRVLSRTSVRFDAFLAVAPRQHVASLATGTLEGSWVAVGSGTEPSVTGSFTAHRESP
jgi:hypothetical protein